MKAGEYRPSDLLRGKEIPDDLLRVLDRMLAKTPDDRFSTSHP